MTLAVAAAAVAGAAPPTSPRSSHPAPIPATGRYPTPVRYQTTPARYQFEYSVADRSAGLEFGQEERRDAAKTSGSYRVLLPDGRHQRVRYSVLGADGYLADVTYEGEARAYYPAPRKAPAGRPRTYTLQSVTEAPLADTVDSPTDAEAGYVEAAALIGLTETAEAELADAVLAEATEGAYDPEEESAEEEQAAVTESGGYGAKLQSIEQAQKLVEPKVAGPVYQPVYHPRYQPRYHPRYYSRHYSQHYPRHYSRYYPRYRPAVRARTYYTQQVAPEVVSPPTTPAAPLLETVEDEKAAGQTYSAGPTDAGPAALGSHESESESEGNGSESGVTVESVTEAGSYEPRVEIESTKGSYEPGDGDDSVTEAVYGLRISEPELDGPAVRTTAVPQSTVQYGERTTVVEDGGRYRQETTQETTAAAVTVTETAVETVGPIYRQDIP